MDSGAAIPEAVAAIPADEPGGSPAPQQPEVLALAEPSPVAPADAETDTLSTAATKPDAPSQVLENGGPILTAGIMPAPSLPPKKKGFMSSLFGTGQAVAAPAPQPAKPLGNLASAEPAAKPVPIISTEPAGKPIQLASLGGQTETLDALPGVRQTALFEIRRKSGIDDESDVDLHEDEAPTLSYASAAGLARLAPNGLLKQRESVDTACLKPDLVRLLKTVERRFGKKMIITSGYRSPSYNRKVNGAPKSMHMACAAADVHLPGVSKWDLAQYVRSMQGRGGVGTYCHTDAVHIDVGPERDWNWRCRRRKS